MPLESGGGATGELSTTLLQEPRAEMVPAAFTPLFFLLLWCFFPLQLQIEVARLWWEQSGLEQSSWASLGSPKLAQFGRGESNFSQEEETSRCPGGAAGERNQTQLASLPFVLFTRLRDCSCLQARLPGVLLPILQTVLRPR